MRRVGDGNEQDVPELLGYGRAQIRAFWGSFYATLRAVQAIAEMALDYPIFAQGTAPRTQLLRQFRQTPHAVLFATASFWQGVDVPAAVRALGAAIFHVHAKDVYLDRQNVSVNGVIDTKTYRRMPERSWLFRSVGYGHDEFEWKRIVSALRLAGYDYVMSIEHEDALASVDEGLRAAVDVLSGAILTEPPVEAWWT